MARPRITMKTFDIFVLVAKKQGLHEAVPGISDAGASKQIKALEQVFGGPLFERPPGGRMILNDRGHALVPHVYDILNAYSAGQSAMTKAPSETQLVLAGTRSLCTYMLPELLVRARISLPHTRVVVMGTESSTGVRELVLTRKAELGLVHAPVPPSPDALVAHVPVPEGDDPLVLVVHRAIKGIPKRMTVRELASRPLILFARNSLAWAQTLDLFRQAGVEPNVACEVDAIETAKRCVELGSGFALLPQRAVNGEVKANKFKEIALRGPRVSRTVNLIYSTNHELSSEARAFLQTVSPRHDVSGVTWRVDPESGGLRQVKPIDHRPPLPAGTQRA